MKKTLKNFLLALLATLLLFSTVFLIFNAGASPIVRADDKVSIQLKNELSDDNFAWTDGAAINVQKFKRNEFGLRFGLELKNPKHEDLSKYTGTTTYTSTWGKSINKKDSFAYAFTVMKDNGADATPTALARLHVIYFYGTYNNNFAVYQLIAREELAYYNETINIDIGGFGIDLTDGLAPSIQNMLDEKNMELVSFRVSSESAGLFNDGTPPKAYVEIYCDGPFQTYFCRFEYNYKLYYGRNFWGTDLIKTESGVIDSPSRSISQVILNGIETYGRDGYGAALFKADEAACVPIAESILSANKKSITIEYLENIPGTPFATKKSERIEVSVLSGGVYMRDVIETMKEKQPNFKNFNVLDSNAYNINYIEDRDVYTVYYLPNIYLNAATVDGQFRAYYLDINKSYKDYFMQGVENGFIEQAAFEYMYSTKMMALYPQLTGYTFDQVYGYFAFVAVPQAITFESVMSELCFDLETSYVGDIKAHYFQGNITALDYMQLMNDFGYSMTETFWSTFFKSAFNGLDVIANNDYIETNFYVLYAMPGTNEAIIGEGGQDSLDDTSPIKDAFLKSTQKFTERMQNVINIATNQYLGVAVVVAIIAFVLINKNKKKSKK